MMTASESTCAVQELSTTALVPSRFTASGSRCRGSKVTMAGRASSMKVRYLTSAAIYLTAPGGLEAIQIVQRVVVMASVRSMFRAYNLTRGHLLP